MIVYEDSVQFAMEKCQPLSSMGEVEYCVLLENLGKIHQVNLIHFDIKPSNLMVSTTYDKPVFIDFGLSNIIKEACGFKTLTHFRGTYEYSCK